MTKTQHSTIQRLLGVIEGAASGIDNDAIGCCIAGAVEAISEIVDDLTKEGESND